MAQLQELSVGTGESVAAAVRVARAAPGQTIRLEPNWFKEQVVLDKEVHIVGPREAILEWDEGFTLHCACKGPAAPSVKGVTVRNSAPQAPAVWITEGSRAVVERCNVSSAGLAGIEVHDEGTAPTLRENGVHDCGGGGIYFQSAAGGLAEGNGEAGTLASEGGRGTVEGNDVHGNELAGVQIRQGADPVVRGNRIHDRDQQFGVYVNLGGKGTLVNNVLERLGPGPSDALDVDPEC
eukprot:tig00021098_g18198.t1